MSRRDTIVVAVLINAGLLLILFATAMRSDVGQPTLSQTPAPSTVMTPQEETMAFNQDALPVVSGDEVDQVLSQWSATPTQGGVGPSVSLYERDTSNIAAANAAVGQDYVEVTVKKGDVLERLAKANGTSVQEIMKANQLNTTRLKIGQVLRVPRSAPSKPQKIESVAKEPAAGKEYYTMKRGDSLWTIAAKYHTTVDELLKINRLDEEKARRLKPGDQILVR